MLTFDPVPEPDIVMDVPWGGWPCAIGVVGDVRLISGDDARGGEDGERSSEGGSTRPVSTEEDAIWLGVRGRYVSCGGSTQSWRGKITPGGGTIKLF